MLGHAAGAAQILTDHLAVVHSGGAILPLDQFPDLITPALQPIVTRAVASVPASSASGPMEARINSADMQRLAEMVADAVAEAMPDSVSFDEPGFRRAMQRSQRITAQGQY